MKVALGLLWEQRKRLGSAVPVLVCHDEIVLECAADEAAHVADVLRGLMVRGMERVVRRVPVVVEVTICQDWSGTPCMGADRKAVP
jgi:DNA polymerase-1